MSTVIRVLLGVISSILILLTVSGKLQKERYSPPPFLGLCLHLKFFIYLLCVRGTWSWDKDERNMGREGEGVDITMREAMRRDRGRGSNWPKWRQSREERRKQRLEALQKLAPLLRPDDEFCLWLSPAILLEWARTTALELLSCGHQPLHKGK